MSMREWLQELLNHPVSAVIAWLLLLVVTVTALVALALALWPFWTWLSAVLP